MNAFVALDSAANPTLDSRFTASLADQITRLAGHINAANYRFLKLVAEFDRTEGWTGSGIRSCAHWLVWKCGMNLGVAREKVRVAHKLEQLPLIDAAFASGRLSYSIVRAITRVATTTTETTYLNLTEWGTAAQLERVVRKHRLAQRLQMKDREAIQHECRQARVYQDDDGMWVVTARLPAVAGELVANAIGAIVELDEESETFPQKRASALCKMAEHYLADASGELKDLKGAERCQVMLHVDAQALRREEGQLESGSTHCCVGEHNWVHPSVARRLSCDASIVTVLKGEQGEILNIGRRARTIPPAIKRAMDVRDQGCRYPGCMSAQYVDGHHIKHWADGGETSLDNLVTLCRFHHRKLHEGEFEVHKHPRTSDAFLFQSSQGQEIKPTPDHAFHDHDVSAETLSLEPGNPDVSAQTCVTKWLGDKLEVNYVVDLMMDREGVRQGRPSVNPILHDI